MGGLAKRLGTKVIHVAEHDTQIADVPKHPGEFVNTWSIPGFCGEGSQPAELGWGSHEKPCPGADIGTRSGQMRDLSRSAGLRDPGALLDAHRRAAHRLSHHPWRIDHPQ